MNVFEATLAEQKRLIAEQQAIIKDLQTKLRVRNLIIDTLRGTLHTAWFMTNNFEKAEEDDE